MSYSNVQKGTPGGLTVSTFIGNVVTTSQDFPLDTGMIVQRGGVQVTFSLHGQNVDKTRVYSVIAAIHPGATPDVVTVNEFSQDNGDDISAGITGLSASIDGGSGTLIITVHTASLLLQEQYIVNGFAILAGVQS